MLRMYLRSRGSPTTLSLLSPPMKGSFSPTVRFIVWCKGALNLLGLLSMDCMTFGALAFTKCGSKPEISNQSQFMWPAQILRSSRDILASRIRIIHLCVLRKVPWIISVCNVTQTQTIVSHLNVLAFDDGLPTLKPNCGYWVLLSLWQDHT